MRRTDRKPGRNVAGFSIAQAAIGISLVTVAVAFLFRWIGQPADARVAETIFFVLNLLPAAGAFLILGLLVLLGAPFRFFLLARLPLTFVLSIPFWLWTDRRWRRRLERRVSEEVERRIKESREGGVDGDPLGQGCQE